MPQLGKGGAPVREKMQSGSSQSMRVSPSSSMPLVQISATWAWPGAGMVRHIRIAQRRSPMEVATGFVEVGFGSGMAGLTVYVLSEGEP